MPAASAPAPSIELNALALDDDTVPEDEAATINITGASSGSTITVHSGSLPTGMTLNSGARTISGTPTTADEYEFTLRETHADGTNSPRDTMLSIEVEVAAPSYDYFIDATNGDDGDDGSEGTPWQSLSKINTIALGAGATVTVLVKSDTYDTVNDWIERSATGGQPGAGSTLEITFEAGCVMDGTAATAVGLTNGMEFAGSNAWTANVYGNGLIVQNYDSTASGGSANGVGNRGSNTANIYDVIVTGCVDGFSAHETSELNLFDCEASDCDKSPFLHVDDAVVTADNCTFTEKTGGGTAEMDVCDTSFAGSIACTNCTFIPDGASSRMRAGNASFYECEMGTTTAGLNIQWTSPQDPVYFEDSYVNVYIDGAYSATLLRCFGKFTTRIRPGGVHDIQHCVFSGGGAGQASVILGTTNLSGCQTLTFQDNIVETATAAACMNMSSTVAAYCAAVPVDFTNNVLSGSAAYDNDFTTAMGGTPAGTVSADALIGAANTQAMADYGYAGGSPAIGAAHDGGNCGFAVGDAVAVGAA